MSNVLYVCNGAKLYNCTTCVHSTPHIEILIDDKPCKCPGWCIPSGETCGKKTQCEELVVNYE